MVSKQDWQNLTLEKSETLPSMCLEYVATVHSILYPFFSRVLNSPPLDTKCNMPIMRTCKRVVMRLKAVGETWSTFEKSGANSQGTREQKTLPQLTLNQRLRTTFKVGKQSPQQPQEEI